MAQQNSFTLFQKADFEGYLEKINTGITSKWLSGKTKLWCELYGATLYMFKDNKRSSTGAQNLDMSQVHMVRKASNDKTGTQFEIVSRNKPHIFCAASETECNTWMGHLQTAMTLRDQSDASASQTEESLTSTPSLGDYETIKDILKDNPTTPQIKMRESSTSESGYAEVNFVQPPACVQHTANEAGSWTVSEEDGYATVEFVAHSIQPTSQGNKDSAVSPTSVADKPSEEDDGSGYSTVEMRKKSVSSLSENGSMILSGTDSAVGDVSYPYATVNKVLKKNGDISEYADCMSTKETSDDAFEIDELINSGSQNSSIPSYPHPLQPEDLEPLAALKEFLSDNRKLCRPSFSEKTSDNPLDDIKRVLAELSL